MTSSNISRMHQYLQAVASMGPYEDVAAFHSPEVAIQEFPNRIAPEGRICRGADLRAAYEKGRQLLRSQT